MVRHLLLSVTILGLLGGVGCRSIGSTMLTRDESNQRWERHRCLNGVPITLKVPTHVKIYIYEHHYLDKVNIAGVERIRRVELPYVVRDFAQEYIYTEKIFTVDFKRPAAGTFNLRLDMTEDQYIQKVQQDVTDKTIEEVGNLLETLGTKTLFASLASGQSTMVDNHVTEITSVVAVGVFEVDAPDFECQLTSFINCHLNQAHDAWVVAPNVESLRRVEGIGMINDSNLCAGLLTPWNGKLELWSKQWESEGQAGWSTDAFGAPAEVILAPTPVFDQANEPSVRSSDHSTKNNGLQGEHMP